MMAWLQHLPPRADVSRDCRRRSNQGRVNNPSRAVGEVETRRGTSDPTDLHDTLGKLEILKLRADVKARQGSNFHLMRFHDDFTRQRFAPISIVRQAMLNDDSPTL